MYDHFINKIGKPVTLVNKLDEYNCPYSWTSSDIRI